MEPEPIIKLENVSLWYNKGKPIEVKALKNITLDINKGDYAAFFGPSGCGKTTMLYSISGIDRFQEGKILINGRDISGLSNQELAIFRQTGIGIVFQQFNLVPSLTVLKNVSLPMLFVGISSEKADIEAAKLLKRLDMTEYADRYPFELSGGQQQRVGIARALANDPPIIIADEPLGNLDSINAKKVLEFLRELNEKDGRTIIMVTHEAWSLRDVKTIFHMKDGVITDTEHITSKKTVAESLSNHLYEQLSAVKKSDKSTGEKEDVKLEQLSAHLLSNFLLRGYSMEEIQRFEEILNELFANKITAKEFKDMINKPFKDGGVGLWKKKASSIANYLEEIITKRKDIEGIYKSLEQSKETSIFDEIHHIRDWLVQGYTGELTPWQIMALDQVISDRVRNLITAKQVPDLFDLSKNKFGVGLSFRASHLMAEKLELILDNGENSSKKEEENNNNEPSNYEEIAKDALKKL
ncbi:MAG: ABC transporter ATP-binding protein [bacterium]